MQAPTPFDHPWSRVTFKSQLDFGRGRVMFVSMKLLWLLCLCICSGCSHPDYKAAIQHVLDARIQIRNEFTHAPRDRTELMSVARMNPKALIFDAQDYALVLQTINPKDCPTDFRQAWSGYVSAWHYRANATDSPSYVLETGRELSQSETEGAFDEGHSSNSDGESRTVSAWKAVQDVSTQYGVSTE